MPLLGSAALSAAVVLGVGPDGSDAAVAVAAAVTVGAVGRAGPDTPAPAACTGGGEMGALVPALRCLALVPLPQVPLVPLPQPLHPKR
jgi:hypothetical protein